MSVALPFEQLVEEHGRTVLRYCVARLGPEGGQDAFQETLLSALRAYDRLRHPASARAWLMAIAHRQVIDSTRAHARGPVPVGDVEPYLGTTVDAPADHDGLWSHVAGLPPKQREAVALRYVADLPHSDVAQIMGISIEAARRNVHEGLRALARRMEVPA